MNSCRIELQDCTFSDAEIAATAEKGRLLTMEVEVTTVCNFRCPYCYVSGDIPCHTMPYALFEEILAQARKLGARRIVLLGGEPMLHPRIADMVAAIHAGGMIPELFTNGVRLTEELLRRFYDCGAFLVLKYNAMTPEGQNRMGGVPDADVTIQKAFLALTHVYREKKTEGLPPPAFGLSTIISRANYGDIEEIWRLARRHGFLPCVERMNPVSHAVANGAWLNVTQAETHAMFELLARIDREEFGLSWSVQPPLVGRRCLRNLYSCTVSPDGSVKPCVGIPLVVGNVMATPLADILRESKVIRDLRHYRETMHGPCRNCPRFSGCYGCRGSAYQLTGDYLASDPLCWNNQKE
ncbi:MAG: radical SAM protein [Kiritimatiellae bacterium]|nr:radical SAM protein [Kiritimatiellia bacterium]